MKACGHLMLPGVDRRSNIQSENTSKSKKSRPAHEKTQGLLFGSNFLDGLGYDKVRPSNRM
jgi:hypothetical protein